ncbi:MAG: ybaB [Phycisphaerales bacterium]|nr:ybaB [Phycisphaerales bacterium]
MPIAFRRYRPNNAIMLDALKNLGNLPGLMQKAREMQDKMKAFQDELARKTFDADAAGGAVTATVNGKFELKKIRIDKTKVDPADVELLEDLVVAAVNAAQTKAASAAQSEMAKMSGDLGLPPGMIPGM